MLGNALSALDQNRASLMAIGRYNGDPISFFIVGVDTEPVLQAIYVPPDIRNMRLGSSLFVMLATSMAISDIEVVSLLAWGSNIRFFERLGAKRAQGQRPDMNGALRMTFRADGLLRPPGWFEKNVLKNGD
ncbi:hypothetical protein [Dongia sp.]|uniref:hypothetical protein n=1 Tax=Dongia sp. TaxID=1977262 RepID=UPI0035B21108